MASSAMPPVCILAGGRGVRLGDRVMTVPKPILPVAGRPFLLHQLELLSRHGITAAVLCVGYLGEQIRDVIGSERYGISIAYSFDSPALDGTLGAIRRAAHLLGPCFLVLYGDTYLRIDYAAVAAAWTASGLPAMMTVLHNEGRWDESNVEFDGRHVIAHDKFRPTEAMRWIDYGLGGLTDTALALAGPGEADLATLYSRLASSRQLFGIEAIERFYEIGSPAGLRETEAFLAGIE
jgi:MurNAc alpha-1-phosphate uridylyltransferase